MVGHIPYANQDAIVKACQVVCVFLFEEEGAVPPDFKG